MWRNEGSRWISTPSRVARYACAEHSDSVVDGLLERVEIALLLKWRPKRWAIECPGEHCKGLPLINVLKRIDEIAQLDFTVGERNSVDEAPQQKFGPKPEMLLEPAPDQITTVGTPRFTAADRTWSRRLAETLPRHTNLKASGLPITAFPAAARSLLRLRLPRLTH